MTLRLGIMCHLTYHIKKKNVVGQMQGIIFYGGSLWNAPWQVIPTPMDYLKWNILICTLVLK